MTNEKANRPQHIEYICTYCGQKQMRGATSGRPMPGNCPRKERMSDGKMRPHTGRINRKF